LLSVCLIESVYPIVSHGKKCKKPIVTYPITPFNHGADFCWDCEHEKKSSKGEVSVVKLMLTNISKSKFKLIYSYWRLLLREQDERFPTTNL